MQTYKQKQKVRRSVKADDGCRDLEECTVSRKLQKVSDAIDVTD